MASTDTLVKRLQDIMRMDDLSGTVQYLKQTIWLLFLKIYDAKEEKWEILEDDYQSIIPEKYRWHNWAEDHKDGKALTGDDLIKFINGSAVTHYDENGKETVEEDPGLIKTLKSLDVDEKTPKRQLIVYNIFQDVTNTMKSGTRLRQMINVLNEIDFSEYQDAHEFGDIYESMLKDLQESKKDGGEFYTPRALTDFVTEMVDPRIGDTIADFACGTGGFLVSALKYLENKVDTNSEDMKKCGQNLYGIEKKSFPYELCLTNLILHDVDEPNVVNENSLMTKYTEFKEKDKFDIILMNPPYGGTEDDVVKSNFPVTMQCSETANLFMVLIMYRLKANGRAGVVLPDGFLFGDDGAIKNIKEYLFDNFNVHTIIRLPKSVFAPYASIATNIIFFDNNKEGTKETWFYRLDMPDGYKAFSKTKPIKSDHFQQTRYWWKNREEIVDKDGFCKAKKYSKQEIKDRSYNIDLCGYPKKVEEILEPKETIENYLNAKDDNDKKIRKIIKQIQDMMENGK